MYSAWLPVLALSDTFSAVPMFPKLPMMVATPSSQLYEPDASARAAEVINTGAARAITFFITGTPLGGFLEV